MSNNMSDRQSVRTPQGDLDLLDEPLAQELLEAAIPGRLAYVAQDGTPRIVPSWFQWDGKEIVTATWVSGPHVQRAARRLDDLEKFPDVAFSIDTDEQPARILQIRGRVDIEIVDGLVDEYRLAAHRYLENDADDYLASFEESEVRMARIAVRPGWVGLIDFDERPPQALDIAGESK